MAAKKKTAKKKSEEASHDKNGVPDSGVTESASLSSERERERDLDLAPESQPESTHADSKGAATKKKSSAKKKKATEAVEQPDPRAPLDPPAFLKASAPVLKTLKQDLLERAEASSAVKAALSARYEREKKAQRTGDSFIEWRSHFIDQVAAAWLLSCVFVRTLEDRGLLGHARIAGEGALDSQRLFFEIAPSLTQRDYLLTIFRELSRFPATKALFDEHNPVWMLAPSKEAAQQLLQLFRTPNAENPTFRFGQPDTRFLGDLYQDLDEGVRKRFALLQTPVFVEEYILDRTLEPAIQRFGLDETTLIDPTCGSGHFLLGAFQRLFNHRRRSEPNGSEREAVFKALSAVAGADINPYAIAIARLRLTLAALELTNIHRLSDAPELPLKLVAADSLLYNTHVPQQKLGTVQGADLQAWLGEIYAFEDPRAARDVLHREYAAVVGNPPYITCKDPALREVYREIYPSAAGKYALSAPFTERFFQLGKAGAFVGMITANSFMKREFGKCLIEQVLRQFNLTRVENTSGAYIPGHGTPTVLLFGTKEKEQGTSVHAVLANRGEPQTPEDPSRGLVWRSIVEHGDEVGFDNDFISVAQLEREILHRHPWTLGGGGTGELKELLEQRAPQRLCDIVEDIGFASFTGLDDAFILPQHTAQTFQIEPQLHRPMVIGENVRDWAIADGDTAICPYDSEQNAIAFQSESHWGRWLWPFRTVLKNVASFGGKTREDEGQDWWCWYRWQSERYRAAYRIAFAFVATHNHFVLDRGGKVFNRSAPIIKLPEGATEEDHLALLAYLNSSTACFWMKQVFQPKHSAEHKTHPEPERNRFEFSGTQLAKLPIPPGLSKNARLIQSALRLSEIAMQRQSLLRSGGQVDWDEWDRLRESMIPYQEEIDWEVYRLFGLVDFSPDYSEVSGICPRGDRPCERFLPRRSFVRRRDHLVPLIEAECPPRDVLSPSLSRTWGQRTEAIRKSPELQMLEHPLHKRQWRDTDENVDEFAFRADCDLAAMRRINADALEGELAKHTSPCTARALALKVGADEAADLLFEHSVPFLAAYRFTDAGLRKFEQWQTVWGLQRAEDNGEAIEHPPSPPAYEPKDYRESIQWSLRGKLDVPKERFIRYQGCESDEDSQPVYGWAGWNHLERARALAALYNDRKREGWTKERLLPMLAGILELLPWVKQWHNEPDVEFEGLRLGDFFENFLEEQMREHGVTAKDLEAIRSNTARKAKTTAKKKTAEPLSASGEET